MPATGRHETLEMGPNRDAFHRTFDTDPRNSYYHALSTYFAGGRWAVTMHISTTATRTLAPLANLTTTAAPRHTHQLHDAPAKVRALDCVEVRAAQAKHGEDETHGAKDETGRSFPGVRHNRHSRPVSPGFHSDNPVAPHPICSP